MEIFGIFLSIPVAFAANALYCHFLVKIAANLSRLPKILRLVSYIVLTTFVIEIVLLVTLGAVRSRGLLGPPFYAVHLLLFFLGPPALANLLVLRPQRPPRAWYVAAVACTAFAFFLVLLQYSVSESLYGINGDDGPYSGNSTLQR